MATDWQGNWVNPDQQRVGFKGFNMTPFGAAAGGANIGAGLAGLFGNQKTGFDAANPYISQIGKQAGQYYDPYIQGGQNAMGSLQDQYSSLLGSPGQKLNEIGSNYQQSPGFKFALQQALQGAGHAAAAGGMAGSPQHSQQEMQMASDIASQDYNKWLEQATGLYGQGLTGQQGMAGMGLQAGTNQSNLVAQQLAQQAQLAAEGQKEKNQNWGNAFSNIGSGLGMMAFL